MLKYNKELYVSKEFIPSNLSYKFSMKFFDNV